MNLPYIQIYNKSIKKTVTTQELSMPIYEYHCNNCESNFEMMLRFSDSSKEQKCPNCHDTQTQKKLSSVSPLIGINSGVSNLSTAACNSRGGFS